MRGNFRILGVAASIAGCVSVGLFEQAHAYETDQISARQVLPPDSSDEVDAYVNARLEKARRRAERKIRKKKSSDPGAIIRNEIIREFPFNFLFFGAPIEKWMTDELSERGFAVEPDGPGQGWDTNIYDQYRKMFRMDLSDFPTAAMVFHFARGMAGTYIAPTFNGGGVLYGADKWSHFFRLGYRYWQRSSGGTDDASAIAYGTSTEMGGIGYATSGAFSYADLAANYDGYRFFKEVYGTRDAYFVLRGGHLVQRRSFSSREYVSDDWDEYLNPCVYRPNLLAAIHLHFDQRREEICREFASWKDDAVAASQLLRSTAVYTDLTNAPEQSDPFRLDELCRQ